MIDESGLDQESFAAQIGAARETVSRWLNGKAKPDQDSRRKLAEEAARLFGGPVTPGLFRESVSQPPVEEVAAQLLQTGRILESSLAALIEVAGHVVPLLERQEALVLEMRELVAELKRLGAASGGARGPG